MDVVKQHYVIDMASNNNFIQIAAMQGDGYGVRYAEIELVENGKQYNIDPTEVDTCIMGTKPDTKEIWNPCEITSEGFILVELTQQMLAVAGRGDYSIVINHKTHNRQLKSFPFILITTTAPYDPSYIESTDEFQQLLAIITSSAHSEEQASQYASAAQTAQTKAETAQSKSETAQSKAELAQSKAETAVDNAEYARSKAELAQSNAEKAQRNAQKAQDGAELAQSLAETAWYNAENASDQAKFAQGKAELAQYKAEQAEAGAEVAKDDAEAAADSAENARDAAEQIAKSTTFTVDFTSGELEYTNDQIYVFTINQTTGDLEWRDYENQNGIVIVPGKGHTILDTSGNSMADRSKLLFSGFNVSDDSTNDQTIVSGGGGTSYSEATPTTPGLMSAIDKSKLDGIADNANNYIHPSSSGFKHIPSGGSSGQILGWSADGEATWVDKSITTYNNDTSTTSSINNIQLSTTDLVAGVSNLDTGQIYLVYE